MSNESMKLKGDGRIITNHPSIDYIPLKGELVAKLVPPHKMLLFWDVSEIPSKIMERYFSLSFDSLIPLVRIYDVTDLDFNGKNAHHFFEISVPYYNGHWFIKGLVGKRNYVAELGINVANKEFFPLFRSNIVHIQMMEIPEGSKYNYELIQLKHHEEQLPKWMDHVSTYSYYEKATTTEDING